MKEEVEEDNVKERERERKRERDDRDVNHITEFSNAIKYTSTLPKLLITTTKQ